MAKIKNPVRFSDYFNLNQQIMESEGLFDPILNVDTKLFIDPLLLERSHTSIISNSAIQQYNSHFEKVMKLLKHSRDKNDVAWKAAKNLLTIREVQGTSLGYGVGSTNGRNLPDTTIETIVNTAKEIVDIGIDDPELFALLPLIQDGIGADFISDFTTSIIEEQLLTLTELFAMKYGLPLIEFEHKNLGKRKCLINPLFNIPILLVPKDILGKLPTASDWSGVREAADFSDSLRIKVNSFISEIWAKRAKYDKKRFMKELIGNKNDFNELLSLIKSLTPKSYNFVIDEKGLVFWHEWLSKAAIEFPISLTSITYTHSGLLTLVETIIDQYKFLIENRGLNKLLWIGEKRAPEKVSQLLFFAISYSYVKANDIDINPEIDAGSGLIDFKFSHGFSKRIIVEIKLTSNQNLVPGYQKQLEIYKQSEETSHGYYVVMDVGSAGKKLKSLEMIKDDHMSQIIIIDASKKPPASKLK